MTKILIIRLSSLGDIIHTYPMVYDIKKNLNQCEVHWLVDESFAEVVRLNKAIDNVIPIPLRNWKKNKFSLWFNIKKWQSKLPLSKYDYIIDSQGLLKSALLAKCFTGTRYGLGINSIKEKLASFLYNIKIETGKKMLALTKNRLLAAAIFKYELDTNSVNFGLSNYTYKQLDIIRNFKYVIFFHATSKISKEYPQNLWIELAKYLINNYNLRIILPFGNEIEKNNSLAMQKLAGSNSIIVPNKRFSYAEMSSLISYAEFIFGVDTGLIHLANALDKKLIAIYVDTNPNKTGVCESEIAKNIGNIGQIPTSNEIINLFEIIRSI